MGGAPGCPGKGGIGNPRPPGGRKGMPPGPGAGGKGGGTPPGKLAGGNGGKGVLDTGLCSMGLDDDWPSAA